MFIFVFPICSVHLLASGSGVAGLIDGMMLRIHFVMLSNCIKQVYHGHHRWLRI